MYFMSKKNKISELDDNPKERIMDTALRLFYTQGYNNTGINQILEESKTFKLSFYNYFSSKENLGIEYIKRKEKSFLNLLKRIMDSHSDYKNFIHVWIKLVKKDIIKSQYKGCPFVNIALQTFGKEDTFKPYIKSMIKRWKNLLSRYLIQNYDYSKEESNQKSGLILQIYEGAVQLYIVSGNVDYINDLEENLKLVVFSKKSERKK